MFLAVIIVAFVSPIFSQSGNYEGAAISGVEIQIEGSAQGRVLAEQLKTRAAEVVGNRFSAVKNREALQALFDYRRDTTQRVGRVASVRLEVVETGTNPKSVLLRFIVRRTNVVEKVVINIGNTVGKETITEEELLLRLNLLQSGMELSERAMQESADTIQTYLRDRGFYNADVTFRQEPSDRETRINAVFDVNPNEEARVGQFEIKINGFDDTKAREKLKLKPGEYFSRQKLNEDVEKIRQELVKQDFLAADLTEPRINFDADKNTISIEISGRANAKVNVRIEDLEGKEIKISESTQRKLLPIKRESGLDDSAIEEGRRRLRIKFQEDGYFFAEVEPICSVNPYLPADESAFTNNTRTACSFLSGANLEGRTVEVTYKVDLNRRLKLNEIRLEGTNALTIAEIKPALRTQEANVLGFVPRLGYGRGYTSLELLDEDRRTITALMRELGYRKATVSIRQGVSPAGEDLIITFVVREGPLTRVSDVEIVGNKAFTNDQLKAQLPELINRPYSRARTRTGNDKILDLYAKEGFIEARSTFATVDEPSPVDNEERVKIVYTIEREGEKTFINRILTFGARAVKREAILEIIPLKAGDVLRADFINESERNLYATDAFRQITITTEPAGTKPDGSGVLRDVIINLEEAPPRVLNYGGGASTDDGARGFVDIRHVNLLGKLYTGGARLQASRRQQLFQLDFTNPRFLREPDGRFAPLTFTAQYLRDTGVTRFFRTTLDKGAFGVVQRLDAEGNPIDEFGQRAGEPAISRITLNLETSRTLQRSTRTLLFARFRYEDVRLLNIKSLLVAPVLQPDRVVRISGFGATFARDTRENCNNRRTLLERIRTGDEGNPCQYNAADPTKGEFLSVDYQLSARFLGAGISFNRISATYQRYFQFRRLNNTVLAGRAVLGAASLFSVRDRDGNGVIDETDKTLPISERFFAGGSTTLRGFEFEQAGPRQVIMPVGQFRNRDNNLITIPPFTVPVGGNAVAITNLEARVPLTTYFQVVPFYDGGNVFRRVGDIFKPRASTPNNIDDFNLRTLWTNTVGLGVRLKTPIGGSLAVDWGYLLNPPEFIIPQTPPPNIIERPRQSQIHFRFTQAF